MVKQREYSRFEEQQLAALRKIAEQLESLTVLLGNVADRLERKL